MIKRLIDGADTAEVQETAFSTDIVGRYVCNTWDEATSNGGIAFDAIVIGAGMFGAYCAEKLYRNSNLRVLVLEAGSFLVSEHVQNLARIGLNVAGAAAVGSNAQDPGTRERVWGSPWRSPVAFPGLAYCVGGRSLYFGGWAPQLTGADLAQWHPDIEGYLNGGAYKQTEEEIGVAPATDYISGPLYEALHKKFHAAITTGGGVPNIDEVNKLKDGAPLAVQAAAPASGLFSFDKFSSAPILVDAIREAADSPDWRRRLFLVPRAHVVKLHTDGQNVIRIEAFVNGQRRFLDVAPACAVVLASGTIEATRLALESFPTPIMGRNLMAHLRSNTTVRIKRDAIDPALKKELEAAALVVRGSTPQGRFHLQVTAAAVGGANPEVAMFRMIPDVDLLDQFLASQTAGWIVITLRGIGEMQGDSKPTQPRTTTGSAPSWIDLSDQTDEFGFRRAWVNLAASPADGVLWDIMDDAALALAIKLANNDPANIEYFYKDSFLDDGSDPGSWHQQPPPRSPNNNRKDFRNKVRDGLGTTHHETGTLWMGSAPATSVTDLDGRFHHINNAYVVGPAIFPTVGSANPSLTGLALAKKTALAIARRSLFVEKDFLTVGNGGLAGWRMAGAGGFIELGQGIIESVGGPGLLWFVKQEFDNFILRLEWQTFGESDNSGVYIRIPALGPDFRPADAQGYEIQIDERGIDPQGNPGSASHRTGAVYALTPSSKPDFPRLVGRWNAFEIEANGGTIAVSLNGQPVSRLDNGRRSLKGFIGLQSHHPGSRVQFRNIRIKSLAPVPQRAPARAPA